MSTTYHMAPWPLPHSRVAITTVFIRTARAPPDNQLVLEDVHVFETNHHAACDQTGAVVLLGVRALEHCSRTKRMICALVCASCVCVRVYIKCMNARNFSAHSLLSRLSSLSSLSSLFFLVSLFHVLCFAFRILCSHVAHLCRLKFLAKFFSICVGHVLNNQLHTNQPTNQPTD